MIVMEGVKAPEGEEYEPGVQVKKALKKTTAETAEEIVENILWNLK